jgi:hypothetical protein
VAVATALLIQDFLVNPHWVPEHADRPPLDATSGATSTRLPIHPGDRVRGQRNSDAPATGVIEASQSARSLRDCAIVKAIVHQDAVSPGCVAVSRSRRCVATYGVKSDEMSIGAPGRWRDV